LDSRLITSSTSFPWSRVWQPPPASLLALRGAITLRFSSAAQIRPQAIKPGGIAARNVLIGSCDAMVARPATPPATRMSRRTTRKSSWQGPVTTGPVRLSLPSHLGQWRRQNGPSPRPGSTPAMTVCRPPSLFAPGLSDTPSLAYAVIRSPFPFSFSPFSSRLSPFSFFRVTQGRRTRIHPARRPGRCGLRPARRTRAR
jgi:hypothetical protein